MERPANWENMTQKEQELWIYENATLACRFSSRTKKAGEKLAQLILKDDELSGIKVAEIRRVFEHAEKNLKIIYGQTSLRQAADIFDALPEDSASYSAH